MRHCRIHATLKWLSIAIVIAAVGCAAGSRPRLAGRTATEKESLVKPGQFGDNAPSDRRRVFFDFWNESVVRQDLAVSTVFMGDSITELWELQAYFVPTDGAILNRGVSGDIASHMARRFEADVLQLKPRSVVILAGTNDVARMLTANKDDAEIIADVTASVTAMMEVASTAGIRAFVCSILPTNDDYKQHDGKKRILPQINANLRAACAEKGCIYVDYVSAMTDANGDLPKTLARDGLHPHYGGYEIMARVLQAALAADGLRP
ncbi:MAG: G-D-S-L family lipolytic protein [Phycisphaerae bacterium]|nr:G-D-S-L family lipolytic protein [Phycisphaerae bacterium]